MTSTKKPILRSLRSIAGWRTAAHTQLRIQSKASLYRALRSTGRSDLAGPSDPLCVTKRDHFIKVHPGGGRPPAAIRVCAFHD